MTGEKGGPMSLAKPAASWSYVAGRRHDWRAAAKLLSKVNPKDWEDQPSVEAQPSRSTGSDSLLAQRIGADPELSKKALELLHEAHGRQAPSGLGKKPADDGGR